MWARDYFISVRDARHSNDCVLDRAQKAPGEPPPGKLLYLILDTIVDSFFPSIDKSDEIIDTLEDRVLDEPSPETVEGIFDQKRKLIELRRVLVNTRDACNSMLRDQTDLIPDELYPFFRDVHDHVLRLLDSVETLRDLLNNTLDVYLSSVANRTNQVMKVLTVLSTIALPGLVITSFYGMNVKGLPFIDAAVRCVLRHRGDRRLHRADAGGDAQGALALGRTLPRLRDDQSARRGQQQDGEQALALQAESRFAHHFQVRARIVHQDEPIRIHLRQEAHHFLLADGHVAVGKEQVDGAVHIHLQRRLVAQLDAAAQGDAAIFSCALAKTSGSYSQLTTRPKPLRSRPSAIHCVLTPRKEPVSTTRSGLSVVTSVRRNSSTSYSAVIESYMLQRSGWGHSAVARWYSGSSAPAACSACCMILCSCLSLGLRRKRGTGRL